MRFSGRPLEGAIQPQGTRTCEQSEKKEHSKVILDVRLRQLEVKYWLHKVVMTRAAHPGVIHVVCDGPLKGNDKTYGRKARRGKAAPLLIIISFELKSTEAGFSPSDTKITSFHHCAWCKSVGLFQVKPKSSSAFLRSNEQL